MLMKKKIILLLLIFLMGMPVMAQQDSVTALIFTEYYGREPYSAYYELTNKGDTALNLSNFWLGVVPGWVNASTFDWTDPIPKIFPDARFGKRLPDVKIEPNQTLLVNNVWDSPGNDGNELDWRRWTWNKAAFLENEHYIPIHYPEGGEPEFWNRPDLEMFGFDSIDVDYDWMCNLWNGLGATVLFYVYPGGTDSVMVDQVRLAKNPSGDNLDNTPSDVAGVTAASNEYILVRKSSVTKGNTNWDQSRGIDLIDSEWIPIPPYSKLNRFDRSTPYTTVGTHGNYSINLNSSTITIDDINNTLTVPWGILKHDSILNEFDIGPGMAWIYNEDNTESADSAYSTVRDGDILRFMACGDVYEEKDYTLQVAEPGTDMALVFPKRRMRYEAIESEDFNGQVWGGEPYFVTENIPGIDTVGNVPFGTRMDTLFLYLEKAPKADWVIDYVDDLERVDVKDGDKLMVTAEDGTSTKEYYISVLDIAKGENASLSAITWPDKPYYLDGWMGDTIPKFSPTSSAYQVILPYGIKSVPAFTAIPMDINSKIEVQRATSLTGSQAERTTTFTVTSEDGSVVVSYAVLFSIEKRPQDLQLNVAEPFISEVTGAKRHYYEFVNVGDVPLDMSNYLFAWTSDGATPANAIGAIGSDITQSGFEHRYKYGYVPGYKFSDDTLEWLANPAKLYFDPLVNPIVDPGDVFVIGNPIKTKWVKNDAIENSDVITNNGRDWISALGVNFNTWGVENLAKDLQMGMHWINLYLFKIDNDTIIDGGKAVNADPTDYTLVDMVGDAGIPTWQSMWIGDHQRTDWGYHLSMRRKPNIFAGNTDADSTSNRDEWVSNPQDSENPNVYQWIGSHTFDPVTAHKSTVTSTLYLVSVGYQGIQSIQGDLSAVALETFYDNISKADEGQTLSVIDGSSGLDKDLTANMAGDDTLIVVSTDGKNLTKYAIIDLPLDDNAMLTALENSGITFEVDGETGLIKGVTYGAVLEDVMANIVAPPLANTSIIDQNGELAPYQVLNYDTVMVKTLVGASIYIEVISQNGINKVTYRFDPASAASDAFVISSIYEVDQDNNTISNLVQGSSPQLFWGNIEVVKGATATLVDKAGFERTEGYMNFDDKLAVVSEDLSVTKVYYLDFLTEMIPDGNQAPTVTVTFSQKTITDILEVDVEASVDDDGLPFGSELVYSWSVIEGTAANVSFADAAALATKVTFASTGNYKLQILADDTEKSATAEVSISVKSTVGINQFNLQSRMYPNPANDKLNIDIENLSGKQPIIKIIDITGKIVYLDSKGDSKTVIDVSGFNSGLYYVTVTCGQDVLTHKLNIVK